MAIKEIESKAQIEEPRIEAKKQKVESAPAQVKNDDAATVELQAKEVERKPAPSPAPRAEPRKEAPEAAVESSIQKVSSAAEQVVRATRPEPAQTSSTLRSGEGEIRNARAAEELANQIVSQARGQGIPDTNPGLTPAKVKELTLSQQAPPTAPKGLSG